MRRAPTLPATFNGEIYQRVGQYARQAVLYAFEEIGGADGLATWARDNEDEFYTKLFPKIITRETETKHVKSLDELMDAVDGTYEEVDEAEEMPVMDHTDGPAAFTTTRTFDGYTISGIDDEGDSFDELDPLNLAEIGE